MMKHGGWVGFLLALFITPLVAAPLPPLVIATDIYSPPFVMRGANDQLFGFDIDIIEHVCKTLNRPCEYKTMPFQDLLQAVESKEVDMAIGAITITLTRAKQVNFSIPYLLSYVRVIGLSKWGLGHFSMQSLANKTIGIDQGTIFTKTLAQENLSNIKVIEFNKHADIIQALQDRTIDFALMDAPAAVYWQYQTNNIIVPLGDPFLYGYGFGIAVNAEDSGLLQQVNTALLTYQNNGGFQKAYNEYIAQF